MVISRPPTGGSLAGRIYENLSVPSPEKAMLYSVQGESDWSEGTAAARVDSDLALVAVKEENKTK